MDSKLATEDPPEDVHLTMERVLDAERQALAAIEDGQRQAEATLDDARERVRVLNVRADSRIARLHHLCEQRIEAMEANADPPDEEKVALDPNEQSLLTESLKRLVRELTGDLEDDARA
jgi:hypothetical protein